MFATESRTQRLLLSDDIRDPFDPALLTFSQYLAVANDQEKFHPEPAYDLSRTQLNSYCADKADYPPLLRNIIVNGLRFQIRMSDEPEGRRDSRPIHPHYRRKGISQFRLWNAARQDCPLTLAS